LSLALPDATCVAGIDWAAAEYAVCVMDGSGNIVASFTIRHNADGLDRLTRRRPGSVSRGKRPWSGSSARLIGVLLEAGHRVVQVKPSAIKGWPESEVLSGAKSNAEDAAVIAEYLRLRHHLWVPKTYATRRYS
jgi:transposase